MAMISKHINPKTKQPYTTSEYAGLILDIYKTAQEEHSQNPTQPFISPIGGIKDKEILDYCQAVMSIENPYEREAFAINSLTNKQFLTNMKIDKKQIGA